MDNLIDMIEAIDTREELEQAVIFIRELVNKNGFEIFNNFHDIYNSIKLKEIILSV